MEHKININFFGLFKMSFWFTLILVILKLTHVINCPDWILFLPLGVAFALFFVMVFFIGLVCLYLISNSILKIPGVNNGDDEEESDEGEKENDERED